MQTFTTLKRRIFPRVQVVYNFFRQDATCTGDKDTFFAYCAQEEKKLQVSFELETLRSLVRGVTACHTSTVSCRI